MIIRNFFNEHLEIFYFHLSSFIIKYLIEAQFYILTNIKYNKKKLMYGNAHTFHVVHGM
jgi:hypothetical protein